MPRVMWLLSPAPGIVPSNLGAMEFLQIHTWMCIFLIKKHQWYIYHHALASKTCVPSWKVVNYLMTGCWKPQKSAEPRERGRFAPLFLLFDPLSEAKGAPGNLSPWNVQTIYMPNRTFISLFYYSSLTQHPRKTKAQLVPQWRPSL